MNNNIISELKEYKNNAGRQVIGFFDYSQNNDKGKLIIIPPAFGETKRDALKIAYFLVKNGFNVLRYDATDHVGESTGDMIDASLEKLKNDLITSIDFSQDILGAKEVGIVTNSLGVRVSIKAATQDKRIKFLIGLVGIIDVRSSFKAVYHQDTIGEILNGKYRGKNVDDVMGFEVSIDFVHSAIKYQYQDLETTKSDLGKMNIPIVLIYADNDPWVNLEDAKKILDIVPSEDKEFYLIPNAMHQLNENPQAVQMALVQIVVSTKKYMDKKIISPQEIIMPGKDELSHQWLIEEERLRNLLKKSLEGEKEFWEKYLNKFVLIHKSFDYRDFLATITDFLEIHPGDKVLDAGCGNGHFGAWLFEKMIETVFKDKMDLKNFAPIQYTGLDFVENSLKEAMLKHLNITKRVYRELSLRDKYQIVKYKYILSDMEKPLPFPDNCFDKICCNLVISYVKDPQYSVNELIRVLKKGGRMVISSMKPYADLSQIYRNFVDKTESQEELEEARKLLSAAGRIKQKENAGFYRFFSTEELIGLTSEIKNKKLARTFANQANVVTLQK
ncbi:MAG: methyltransferase domain-containing protein [Candidatus Omnitrophica bacterium]|nr:methyltransferase domain-containing protein [Candidatus Omnitrophota bacterium]